MLEKLAELAQSAILGGLDTLFSKIDRITKK